MTEDELKAIEERASEATKGPWRLDYDLMEVRAESPSIARLFTHSGDGRFIAAARSDVPALVAEVRDLREQLAMLDRSRAQMFSRIEALMSERDSATREETPEPVVDEVNGALLIPYEEVLKAVDEARKQEREACARIVERSFGGSFWGTDKAVAAEIRAREPSTR